MSNEITIEQLTEIFIELEERLKPNGFRFPFNGVTLKAQSSTIHLPSIDYSQQKNRYAKLLQSKLQQKKPLH